VDLHGVTLELGPLAAAACSRYLEEFPADRVRYGATEAEAWCRHDTLHLLAVIALDIQYAGEGRFLRRDVDWLRSVLATRDFPMAQFERHLDLVAETFTQARPELAADVRAVIATARQAPRA
jgi:hypothetical protein